MARRGPGRHQVAAIAVRCASPSGGKDRPRGIVELDGSRAPLFRLGTGVADCYIAQAQLAPVDTSLELSDKVALEIDR